MDRTIRGKADRYRSRHIIETLPSVSNSSPKRKLPDFAHSVIAHIIVSNTVSGD